MIKMPIVKGKKILYNVKNATFNLPISINLYEQKDKPYRSISKSDVSPPMRGKESTANFNHRQNRKRKIKRNEQKMNKIKFILNITQNSAFSSTPLSLQ